MQAGRLRSQGLGVRGEAAVFDRVGAQNSIPVIDHIHPLFVRVVPCGEFGAGGVGGNEEDVLGR